MDGGSGAAVLLIIPGLLVSFLGSVMILKPRRVARFQEQMDAIGSKRNLEDVEPAEWNVTLNRIGGCFILLFGGYATLGGFGIIPI